MHEIFLRLDYELLETVIVKNCYSETIAALPVVDSVSKLNLIFWANLGKTTLILLYMGPIMILR